MPANYNTLYDVKNGYYKGGSRPKKYVWMVYKRDAPTVAIAWFKRKTDAAHYAALMSGPLKREPPTPG